MQCLVLRDQKDQWTQRFHMFSGLSTYHVSLKGMQFTWTRLWHAPRKTGTTGPMFAGSNGSTPDSDRLGFQASIAWTLPYWLTEDLYTPQNQVSQTGQTRSFSYWPNGRPRVDGVLPVRWITTWRVLISKRSLGEDWWPSVELQVKNHLY